MMKKSFVYTEYTPIQQGNEQTHGKTFISKRDFHISLTHTHSNWSLSFADADRVFHGVLQFWASHHLGSPRCPPAARRPPCRAARRGPWHPQHRAERAADRCHCERMWGARSHTPRSNLRLVRQEQVPAAPARALWDHESCFGRHESKWAGVSRWTGQSSGRR